ncbi:MAG: hypothetical protein JRG90_06780 [Deltaproteobacteria bacterium]|nr:hypothetical protein [Deltaproteobacteria bacterium]
MRSALRWPRSAGTTGGARRPLDGSRRSGTDEGNEALRELAAEHPDDSVRMLADIALGRKTGDRHD